MSSVNKVILVGNVGKQPEIRTAQSGMRFANFSVATSERWKDKASGEYKEKTEWVNVSVTNDSLIGIVERFVTKGSKVFIEGMLQTRKWADANGADKYSTEVVLKPYSGNIVLLDNKDGVSNAETRRTEDLQEDSAFVNSPSFDDLDDELPF